MSNLLQQWIYVFLCRLGLTYNDREVPMTKKYLYPTGGGNRKIAREVTRTSKRSYSVMGSLKGHQQTNVECGPFGVHV